MKVVLKLRKLDNLIDTLRKDDGASMEWGILKSAGNHDEAKMPVANLQAIHEFRGDGWKRPVFHIHAELMKGGLHSKLIADTFGDYIEGATRKRGLENYLKRLGKPLTDSMKSLYGKSGFSYKGLTIPANTKPVIARKGKDNPLIETGLLRSSIDFRVGRK